MKIIKSIHDYENLSFSKNYVFRGQSNEDYYLLPGTYRNKEPKFSGPEMEKICLFEFFRHLRQSGYKEIMAGLKEFQALNTSSNIFPSNDILPYLALAQHYAFDSQFKWLKTSLLDITYNLDIAAYFAVEKGQDNGKIFIIEISRIKHPYIIYDSRVDNKLMARMAVQDGAFLYREQNYEQTGIPNFLYQNCKPFDDIIADEVVISNLLKENLRVYLQRKLFNNLLFPRLILNKMTPDLPYYGNNVSFEEFIKQNQTEIDRCENAGDKHSIY